MDHWLNKKSNTYQFIIFVLNLKQKKGIFPRFMCKKYSSTNTNWHFSHTIFFLLLLYHFFILSSKRFMSDVLHVSDQANITFIWYDLIQWKKNCGDLAQQVLKQITSRYRCSLSIFPIIDFYSQSLH
jgi:hypothetical protein